MNNVLQTSFGLLTYRLTGDLGDEIQSIAARRFLPSVDVRIDREQLHSFKGDDANPTKVILNGWFMHKPENWPPSKALDPLLISFHISDSAGLQGIRLRAADILLSEPNIRYLKHFGPVGARDLFTLRLLEKAGIDSYFSGCLTLTLIKPNVERRPDIMVLNDLPNEAVAAVRGRTTKKIIITGHGHHAFPSEDVEQRFREAERLLELYASASCVVTTRLHCALPCVAFGTPVLLLNTATDQERFLGLLDLVRNASLAEFLKSEKVYDLGSPPANPKAFLKLRDDLERTVRKFLLNAPRNEFDWTLCERYRALTVVHSRTVDLLAAERRRK
jgi:hypothetical protein